jgi:rhodanese-related sulfurtransferase
MKNTISKIALVLVMLSSFVFASGDHKTISFQKAKGKFNAKSALFLDARGFKLYQKGTIMRAVHMPAKEFKKFKKYLPADKKAKLITFCNGPTCHLAPKLAGLLKKEGYTNVLVYSGGYPEWKEKKMTSMALVKECKGEAKGPYVPKKETAVTINGAKVYWGGEEQGDGMVDQFWLADILNSGKALPANVQLVDIRKPSEFKAGHLPGAINIPWDSNAEKVDHSKFPAGKLIVFYCNTGMQSTDAKGSLDEETTKGVLYFDANVKCKGSKCTVEANENL